MKKGECVMKSSVYKIFGVMSVALAALILFVAGCSERPNDDSPVGGKLVLGENQAWVRDSSITGYIFKENKDFVVIWYDMADPELGDEGGWVGNVQGTYSVSGGTIYVYWGDDPDPDDPIIGTYGVSGNTLKMTLFGVSGTYTKTDNVVYTDIGGIIDDTEMDERLITGYGEAWVNDESGLVFESGGGFYPIVWDDDDEIWNMGVNERGSWFTNEGELTLVANNEEYDPLAFTYSVSNGVLTTGIVGGGGMRTFTKRDDVFPRMVVSDWCWWCQE